MESLSFEALTAALALPPTAIAWAPGWEASQTSFPSNGPNFLAPASVDAACDAIGVSTELRQVLIRTVADLRASEPLCRLAWHLSNRLYADGMLNDTIREWPLLPQGTTADHDLFFAFILLAGVPAVLAFYQAHGIGREVLLATMADVELWVREHRRKTGRWGLSNLRWLTNHFSGNLFQLCRLQFQFGTSRYPYHAWRQQQSRRVWLLADSSVRFSADGYVAGSEADLPLGGPYRVENGAVHGLPIDPRGRALPHPVALPVSEWSGILEPGDAVLNLHIPAGRPMDYDDCGDSFRQANRFFADHFPAFGPKAYVCGSWLLDPQLETAMKPESNLVRFLKEVYLFPLPGASGRQTFERVFGSAEVDPATAPRDTSLRRAILDHVELGGVWRTGGCALFPEDVTHWGRQVYRG